MLSCYSELGVQLNGQGESGSLNVMNTYIIKGIMSYAKFY